MFVCACRINFALPGCRSLKDRRKVLHKVKDKLRHKFRVSVAEVGDPERHQEAEIGFAVISGNERQARAMAENILGYVEDMMIAPLTGAEIGLVVFDDLEDVSEYGDVEVWNGALKRKFGSDEE